MRKSRKILRILEHEFFSHVGGEWNDWRIRRNWDIYKRAIKPHIEDILYPPKKRKGVSTIYKEII